MATAYSAQNIVHMNTKQLRRAAVDAGVDPVTIYTAINQNRGDSDNGKTTLITAIKAK
jgi:hypothetical protein